MNLVTQYWKYLKTSFSKRETFFLLNIQTKIINYRNFLFLYINCHWKTPSVIILMIVIQKTIKNY